MVVLMVWTALVLLACAVCVAIIFATRKPISELLKANSYISPVRKFYLRSFLLVIFSATLGVIVIAGGLCAKQSKCFMECVWWVVDNLSPILWSVGMKYFRDTVIVLNFENKLIWIKHPQS